MEKPAKIMNQIRKIQRDLEQLHEFIKECNLYPEQAGSDKLDMLNEFIKPEAKGLIKLRVKNEDNVVIGDLDYNVHEESGDWIWEIQGVCFTVDDVDFIDPDWGIIQLSQRWEERPNHEDL